MAGVGARIKHIRTKRGWTQEKLAREANISKSFLSDIENDKTRASGDNLLSIAEALGATLDYLMKGDTEAREEPKSVEIPTTLSTAAEEMGISFRDTLMLLDVQKSIVARRSSKEKRYMEKEDWKQLYDKIKRFME